MIGEKNPSPRAGMYVHFQISQPVILIDSAALSDSPAIPCGSSCFFLLLQDLQAGTTFPLVLFPPLASGTTWSMVNSPAGTS
jgi:hypothetical protein